MKSDLCQARLYSQWSVGVSFSAKKASLVSDICFFVVLVSSSYLRDGLLEVGFLLSLAFTCLFCLNKELLVVAAWINILLNNKWTCCLELFKFWKNCFWQNGRHKSFLQVKRYIYMSISYCLITTLTGWCTAEFY